MSRHWQRRAKRCLLFSDGATETQRPYRPVELRFHNKLRRPRPRRKIAQSSANSLKALNTGEANSRRAMTKTIRMVEKMNSQADTIQAITAIPK